MTSYTVLQGKNYHYRRRVPDYLKPYEKRTEVKISLSTQDKKEAARRASIYNDYIEDYWRTLVQTNGEIDQEAAYRLAVKNAKTHGFAYKSVAELAQAPLDRLVSRLEVATKHIDNPSTVSSVLGGVDEPEIKLSECFEKFIPLSADQLVNKSEHQIRKWKNPRKAAMKHFISVVTDKPLQSIQRSDILSFRNWLLNRIEKDDITAHTANKYLQQIRVILNAVAIGNEIDIDFDVMFSKIRLKEIDNPRPPFDAAYVQHTLLSPNSFKTLNDEARLLIYAMADTGARESELIGLRESDIILDQPIPYIWIRAYKNHSLKTPESERQIPLVGSSLYAFKRLPTGFNHYMNADAASATINKYLREHELKPTKRHTLYSLRHTFKDRLRDAQAPEEIIDELMGHKKFGPKYGRGHMLESKYEWMKKIAFSVSH